MKILYLIPLFISLSACSGSPKVKKVSAQGTDIYSMAQVVCGEAKKEHAKGYKVFSRKEGGETMELFMPPRDTFDMNGCLYNALTGDNVKLAKEFLGLGKVALKFVGLYQSAKNMSNSHSNNTTINNTNISDSNNTANTTTTTSTTTNTYNVDDSSTLNHE